MEWKEVTLGEITNLVIDYRGKTPLKLGSSWSDSGYRALSAKNIKTGQIVAEDSIRFVDEELYRKWMKDEVKKGDILITSEAPFGQIYYWDSDEKIVLSQRLFDVRLNDEVCHKYVYYFMTSHRYQKDLEGRATGTTVTGLRQPELLKSTILLPPLSAQRSISSILSSLDRKIELNNKINADLEEMAQAIFKNWFVDFEPFKDGKFVDSELGMIPEGWKVGTLKDLLYLRKDSIKAVNKGNLPYLPIDTIPMRSLVATDFKSNDEAKSSLQTFEQNDIVVGAMRVYFHRVILAPCKGITRTTCFVLTVKNDNALAYSLMQCNQDEAISFAEKTSKGSTMPYAVWDGGYGEYKVVIPSSEVMKSFNVLLNNFFSKMHKNADENSRLSLLRDTLLPRLMSGELEVPE